MTKRLQTLGAVLALIGLGFLVGAGIAYAKVQDGYDSLQSFSAAQNVELSYNCLLYTSPSPRDKRQSRMPSSA